MVHISSLYLSVFNLFFSVATLRQDIERAPSVHPRLSGAGVSSKDTSAEGAANKAKNTRSTAETQPVAATVIEDWRTFLEASRANEGQSNEQLQSHDQSHGSDAQGKGKSMTGWL